MTHLAPSTSSSRGIGMTKGMTLLFALAGGAAVGNLYWAQPLLDVIARDLGVSTGSAGLIITVTQIGYALGVFFLVPLGDIVNRKRVIPTLMVLAAAALAATALAPSFPVLLVTLGLIGVTTVAGQFLTPLAGDLASDDQRGRVLGSVASGLMLGLLISRAISGIVADLFGWRAIFFAAAAVMLVLAVVIARCLPVLEPRERMGYGTLLASVLHTVTGNRTIRVTTLIGASAMCVFVMFWTGLTFLLAAAPYSYSATRIGLVSLIGIAGAVSAQRVGRLFDRGLSLPTLGVGLLLVLAALVLSGLGTTSTAVVLISVALFSIGLQSVQVLIQTRMLSIDPSARSRLNTVTIVGSFIGGAAGSALAGLVWPVGGWPALTIVATTVTGFALTLWLVHRTRVLPR